MKKRLRIVLAAIALLSLGSSFAQQKKKIVQNTVSVDMALKTNKVLISSHRGSWRTAPENSVQSVLDCIKMGVDIAETDLKKTKDGEIILMHDKTIDRTTTGKGKPENYTLGELKSLFLIAATGHPTRHKIPTLMEYLEAAKGKILINIDKGFEYFPKAYPIIRQLGMARQVIYNVGSDITLDSVQSKVGQIDPELYLMVVVNPSNPSSEAIINSYKQHPRTIIQTVFASDTVWILDKVPAIRKRFPVWFNSLWPEHCAGHDDDIAVEENKPDQTWGWIIGKGANIIQTDRPKELVQYLRSRKLHN
jgi:glycerophosphoryl diester phosphodiesterase